METTPCLVCDAVDVIVSDPLIALVSVRSFLLIDPDRRPAVAQIVADL